MAASEDTNPGAPLIRDVVFRPEAERELADAYAWYEEQRPGLGEEFLACVEAALAQARRNPRLYQPVHRNVRRVLTRRFPYGIFYLVEEQRLVIVAVFHGRRDPRSLKL